MTNFDAVSEWMPAWPDSLSAADAMFLKGACEPRIRSTGHLVYVLDSTPDWNRFLAVWDRASRILPPLHQRVVKRSPGRLPVWRDDPDFDLRFHVRRIGVPPPGTLREVLDYAEADGVTPHDPGRPLWQVTLMEGLEGGRAALLAKFHHAWMDGNANIQLARILYDTERDGDLRKPAPERPAAHTTPDDTRPSPANLVLETPWRVASRSWSVAADAGRLAQRVVTNPGGAIAEATELVASTKRLVTPVSAAPSPLLRDRSPRSRFGVLDVPFQDLRSAAKAVDCTVNDAYLAGIARGLRRYHDCFGVPIDEIPMGMPISTRAADDATLGNQVTAAMFSAPLGPVDPVVLMQRFHEIVLSARAEPATEFLAGATNILVHLPERLMAGPLMQLVKIDVSVSQVRGLLEPVYLAGAQLVRSYGFGPHLGVAMFIGMQTHLDMCCIGVHADPVAVTDLDLLTRCLREGFDDVLAVGRKGTCSSAARSHASA